MNRLAKRFPQFETKPNIDSLFDALMRYNIVSSEPTGMKFVLEIAKECGIPKPLITYRWRYQTRSYRQGPVHFETDCVIN